jgi:RNA polymerase sigma-70 factor (ECF subfamily)
MGPSDTVAAFRTTRWTTVLVAAQPRSLEGNDAFARLYVDYWPPLYAYVRQRGCSPAEAEDLTQDFFVALLEKERLSRLKREGGRFRSFLLTALKNHLANEWDRTRAARRGGGIRPLSLDEAEAEAAYQLVSDSLPPERLFERQWALTVIALARQDLEAEQNSARKGDFYRLIGPQLWGDPSARPYAEVAEAAGMSVGALKVAVHRLRHRFGELLREQVARTVDDPSEVQAELRHLIAMAGQDPECPP